MKLVFPILLLLLIATFPSRAEAQVLSGPEVRMTQGDLYVTFSLSLDAKHTEEIRRGIDKELRFHIDLFRSWKVWPDEFVLGKVLTRTVKADPVKNEFIATSFDGSVLVERRFKSLESMVEWTVLVRDLKLTNVRELEAGRYFVRVTVESKIRKLPPVIGYLFIFLSENEFKAVRDSSFFAINGDR